LFRPLALTAFAIWFFVTLVLIQVHLRPKFWRKLGAATYLVVLLEWTPLILLLVFFQDFFLVREFDFGVLIWLGVAVLLLGIVFLGWIVKSLGWRGLIAYSELKPQVTSQKLVTEGPYSIVRHPAYLAHTLILVGIFLMTAFLGNAILALIDFITSYFITARLEEKELLARFGDDYLKYMNEVPAFFPRLRTWQANS
jgi:protein-S-isoprenylcysteine O-methyltransferase Ste14